jgi:hypothetical protein
LLLQAWVQQCVIDAAVRGLAGTMSLLHVYNVLASARCS